MKNKRLVTFRKFLASALCGVFFAVHCALAHSTETNFWASRRMASRQVRGDGETSNSVGSTGQTLLAQLPKVEPLDFGAPTSSSQEVLDAAKVPFSIGPKTRDWLGQLVMPYGTVNDVYLSPKKTLLLLSIFKMPTGLKRRNVISPP
ncbi:MAG: hypothetical protein IPN90_06930 [Elusimicrobia bacterium]|nr:hypothetical protein [Elusimicrobiota bacterium]